MSGIRIKPIVPKNYKIIDASKFDSSIERMLDMTAENMRVDFNVTIQTWNDKPLFLIERNQRWQRQIYTASDIYKFITRGTRVRYATMTKDFKAKTRPNFIGSNKGRGGLAFIDVNNPRPGIQAREFEDEIIKKWNKRIPQMLDRALEVELRKQAR